MADRNCNYSTCTELASHGYVVSSIGHPYHAMYVEDVNGRKTFVDMNFVVDTILDKATVQDRFIRPVKVLNGYEF